MVAGGGALAGVDEIYDYHDHILAALGQLEFGLVDSLAWLALLYALIIAIALALWGFARKGLQTPAVRSLFSLGLFVWMIAAGRDLAYGLVYQYRVEALASMIEETLEFGGALLVGLSAMAALAHRNSLLCNGGGMSFGRIGGMAGGVAVAVTVLGGAYIAFVFQAPVVDTRAGTHIGLFHVNLGHSEAVIQEFRMPAVPISRLDLRLGTQAPSGRTGAAVWRIMEVTGGSDRILRAGRLEMPNSANTKWRRISFPPLFHSEGRRLALLVQADAGSDTRLLVGAGKSDQYLDERLWINGLQAWPNQAITFVAHGTVEPSRSKLKSIWIFLGSDWHWPVLAADMALSLTLLALIPLVLVVGALRPTLWRSGRSASCTPVPLTW